MAVPGQTPPPTYAPRWGILIAAVLMLCVLAYLSGLFGGFLLDDFPNIVTNPSLRALDGSWFRWMALAVSSHSGLLRRPVSVLSFGMDYWLFGFSPLAFKLTNLTIHLANGLLFYQLARRISFHLLPKASRNTFDPSILALLASALWLLHPLNVSTVVYVVQRMDELAALFTLLGLLCYTEGRERMQRSQPGLIIAFAGIVGFGLLAVFSKENGALVTVYALVIEACCFRFSTPVVRNKLTLKAWFVATVALPAALFVVYLVTHPQWLAAGYAGRDFTMYQRLLSEARILCDYLLWMLLPLPHWFGVYHDDFITSTGLLHPLTTLLAIAFLIFLAAVAWRYRRRNPGLAFAIAWFFVGQSMESTILPLELVFDHRNYLPMAGVLLGTVCAVAPWVARHVPRKATIVGIGAIVLALAGTTASWAYAWGDPLRLALTEVADHPNSSRAQYEAGRQIIFHGTVDGRRDAAEKQALPYFERGAKLDVTDLYSASSLILIAGRQGKASSPDAITNLAWRVRHMRLPQINPYLVVQTAAIEGTLRLTPEQMQTLTSAALDNPRLTHSMRAMVLNNYGHYQFQIVHNNQMAVSLTMAAAAEDPANPLFQINLTRLAVALGDANEAKRHLLAAKQLDKAKMYTPTITALEQQLSELARRDKGMEKINLPNTL